MLMKNLVIYLKILIFIFHMEKLTLIEGFNKNLIKEELKKLIEFPKGSKVVIKLHMGEPGNKHYIKAEYVKVIVDALKEIGLKPILFDSPVVYSGGRDTPEKYLKSAKLHGFIEEKIGCPIVVSNESVNVKTNHFTAEACKELCNANILVLSHVKGHPCCAFGGAIKNLGMGGVTKETKGKIHDLAVPSLEEECSGCGICAEVCPKKIISMKMGKPNIGDGCFGCNVCVLNCPNNALKPKAALFDVLLAESTNAVLKKMKNVFFINFLKDIAERCDCYSYGGGPLIADDIGILLGKDIAAIDNASVELINKRSGKDVFYERHKKSPFLQIDAAEKLGMGKKKYELRTVS